MEFSFDPWIGHSIRRFENRADIVDVYGDPVFSFNASWTDAQIWHAFQFAKQAYLIGYYDGELGK